MNISDFKNPFFIGVAGVGMSAIAQYLQGIGKNVSGSDRYFHPDEYNKTKEQLENEGIKCFLQDGSGITKETDLVVVSTAIEDTVYEVKKAKELGIPIIKRSQLLAMIAKSKKTVAVAHKANILKITDGLFLECAREIAKDYPEIKVKEVIIDNMCMQMVSNPSQFEVIVTMNLYGDILSDLAAGLVGGLGIVPGANIGENIAIFEAVHGSAPDIAGKNLANPTALILSAVMMLNHIGETKKAKIIEEAVEETLAEGKYKTKDLGGNASTTEYTEALIAKIKAKI